jgi:hypothetical protein
MILSDGSSRKKLGELFSAKNGFYIGLISLSIILVDYAVFLLRCRLCATSLGVQGPRWCIGLRSFSTSTHGQANQESTELFGLSPWYVPEHVKGVWFVSCLGLHLVLFRRAVRDCS